MRRFIAVLGGLLVLLSGCTPRFEAWRIDRPDGSSSLVIERNFEHAPHPMFWQIDIDTVRLDAGTAITVQEMAYLGDAALDYQHREGAHSGGRRYLGFEREGFERFLVACLGTKPYAGQLHPDAASYRGDIVMKKGSDQVEANLSFQRPGSAREPIYDIIGEMSCTVLPLQPVNRR